jgi:GntR family transcriptional regulator, sialic acid-inducible nan operon repressor
MHLTETRNPIKRRKLYEEVAARIESMLHEGRFSPGDRLPSERELMEELGVGRSAVREAMLSLQKMGILVVRSGERARVTVPTAEFLVRELSGAARLLLSQEGGIRQFQEARAMFEIGLARLAAEKATKRDIEALRRVLETNRRSIADHAEFIRTDIQFHWAIASIPGNPIFTSMYNAVVEWLVEQREISGRSAEAGRAAYAAHSRIFNAIEAHDPAAAQSAMQAHLEQVARFYWEAKRSRQRPKGG